MNFPTLLTSLVAAELPPEPIAVPQAAATTGRQNPKSSAKPARETARAANAAALTTPVPQAPSPREPVVWYGMPALAVASAPQTVATPLDFDSKASGPAAPIPADPTPASDTTSEALPKPLASSFEPAIPAREESLQPELPEEAAARNAEISLRAEPSAGSSAATSVPQPVPVPAPALKSESVPLAAKESAATPSAVAAEAAPDVPTAASLSAAPPAAQLSGVIKSGAPPAVRRLTESVQPQTHTAEQPRTGPGPEDAPTARSVTASPSVASTSEATASAPLPVWATLAPPRRDRDREPVSSLQASAVPADFEVSLDRNPLAFTARLVPSAAPTLSAARGSAEAAREKSAENPSQQAGEPRARESANSEPEAGAASARHREEREPVERAIPQQATAQATPAGASRQAAVPEEAATPVVAPAPAAKTPTPTPDPAPAQTGAPALPPEPPKLTATAHDIKLEVATGDQRVEVRLVERAGEVHLAVRTPDQKLSGALRDNLPELAARLEGTGYRATGSTEAGAEERRGVPQAPNAPQPQSQSDGRQRQRDSQPEPQRQNFEQRNRKEKGNDFAWFMSTLR